MRYALMRYTGVRCTGVFIACSALLGCADVTSQAKLSEMQQKFSSQDDNVCRSQGTTVGTDPYFSCRDALARQHLDEIETAKRERAQAEAAQAQANQRQ
jgi:hypothetical protein